MSTAVPTLPAADLFWAVLGEPTRAPTHSGRPDAEPHLAAFSDLVPAHLDSLFVVTAPIDQDRTIACGVPRHSIPLSDHSTRLHPDALPDLPELADLDEASRTALLGRLNLRVGEFEHPALRSNRSLRSWIVTLAVLALAAILANGFHARTQSTLDAARAADTAAATLLSELQLDTSQLAQELARLRAAHGAATVTRFDASAALASLLSRWPTDVGPVDTQIISVNPSEMTIAFELGNTSVRDAIPTFESPEGWTLEEPNLVAGDRTTRISLRYVPSGGTSR
ncbi:MAG: hypothetical protein ACOYN0_03170 [Phycisphaerales bacterium]